MRSLPTPAQTNTSFFLQASGAGVSAEDLRRLRDAYLFAMPLYAGVFTGGGKAILAHEIGSASLAIGYGAEIEVVLAAFLHGAYFIGDWDRHRRGPQEDKRATLRGVIGVRAEAIIFGLWQTPWRTPDVAALACRREPYSAEERDVIFLRLFEQLEHLLDLGALLFFRDIAATRNRLRAERGDLCRLAERIGAAELAADLDGALERALTAELPGVLVGLPSPMPGTHFRVIPPSCRRRLSLRLYWTLADAVRQFPGERAAPRRTAARSAAKSFGFEHTQRHGGAGRPALQRRCSAEP